MDERPFPHGPLPQAPPSRRGFLVVGGLAVVSAGAGVWAGLHHDDPTAPQAVTDTHDLSAAVGAETGLIALIDRLLKHASSDHRATLTAIRADHIAHRTALRGAIADAVYPHKPPRVSGGLYVNTHPKLGDLRSYEQRAAADASRRAAKLQGRSAALLASIAACETTHLELLR